jgi:hypothetical protein
MGGLNDEVPNKPTFSNSTILLSEVPLNNYECLYAPSTLSSMLTKRGCFAAVYHEGFIYSVGGLNYTEKILRKCERYNIQ